MFYTGQAAQFKVSEDGDGASVGTAEKGFIYVFLIIIFLAGILTMRFFLLLTKVQRN